jgi:hypothetical protein
MSNRVNRDSPLVKSIVAVDAHLSELERVGAKINSTNIAGDVDLEYVQQLMSRFAECGQNVSGEMTNFSMQLQEAQARAEAVAQGVSRQAEIFNIRRNEQNEKLEEFRVLGERVRELTATIRDGDRAKLAANLPAFEAELSQLVQHSQNLRQSARDSRMKALEKNAESLAQKLQSVREKLRDLR